VVLQISKDYMEKAVRVRCSPEEQKGEASRSAPLPSTKCMFSHKSGRFELSNSAPLGDTSATKPQEVVDVQYFF
jgi:hypothetical protein